MRYLLDTCFLSELVKSSPESAVTEWLAQRKATDLYVSALTIGELNRGVFKLVESKRRTELTTWLQLLEVSFESRMLAFTHETARVWEKITAQCEAQGKPLSVFDSLIAATALAKDLTLVTRNVKDFSSTSVHIVNPWVRDIGPSAVRE
jgi:predicted nucleic acid-binding protein